VPLIGLVFFLWINSGCIHPNMQPTVDDLNGADEKPYEVIDDDFILGVGDTIDIAVYRKPSPENIIGIGDTVSVIVYRQTDLSSSFKISAQKGGKILFPLIGEVKASGRDVVDFRNELKEKLQKYIVKPQVDVELSQIQSLLVDDLTVSETVSYNGKIMYPILGDIEISGKALFAVRDELETELAKYIVNPQVTIKVSSVQSQKYYVLGEVGSPGMYTMAQKTSLLEALTKSGWFTDDANRKKVFLIRARQDGVKIKAFDFEKFYEDDRFLADNYINNKDVIYAVPKFIANLEAFMIRVNNIINPILSIQRGIVLWPDMVNVLKNEETTSDVFVAP